MRLIAAAIVVFAGCVMVAGAAIAEAISPKASVAGLAVFGGIVAMLAGGTLFFIEWRAGPPYHSAARPDSRTPANSDVVGQMLGEDDV